MPFQDYPYERPNLEKVKAQFDTLLTRLEEASSTAAMIPVMDEYYALNDQVDTQSTLASIRHSIDTKDAFYDLEQAFFDQESPALGTYQKRFATILLKTPYQADLRAHYGDLLFDQLALSSKTFDDVIIEDLQKENALVTEYGKLTASAEITFDGKTLNLSQMAPYMQSKDRATRKSAQEKVAAFFEANEETFDRIYDDLVKVRVKMAEKLGFSWESVHEDAATPIIRRPM